MSEPCEGLRQDWIAPHLDADPYTRAVQFSSSCGYDGTAIVGTRLLQPTTWLLAEDRIHVAGEIIRDPDASAFLATRYVVGEWCPEVHAHHATLKTEVTQ